MPPTLPKNFPLEYTDSITFTSTGGDASFGFPANTLRLRNRSAKSVYLTLDSTTGATTSGHELGSSEELVIQNGMISGLSFVATSSGGTLTLGAWGY